MEHFAIQRMPEGDYVAPQPDTLVRDPRQARLFPSAEEARVFRWEVLPADVRFTIARFPTTRALP